MEIMCALSRFDVRGNTIFIHHVRKYNLIILVFADIFMHRFFVPPESFSATQVNFPAETARQMNLVLRLKPGTTVIALDGAGNEFSVLLQQVATDVSSGEITGRCHSAAEPETHLTLLLCLTQREKFEWILQKCTEIGVSTFIPVISSRSLVQSAREVEGKYERWQRILREAAEQSHRGIVPALKPTVRFDAALKLPEIEMDCRLIPWEEEHSLGIRQVLGAGHPGRVTLAIGPEGGFSESDIGAAKGTGFVPVTLGPRILRMETAAVAAAALTLYECGDMESLSDQSTG
jgi:16S rRNA (uracil1498-N3)-methyltransferase